MILLFLLLSAQNSVENGLKPVKPLKLEVVKELTLGADPDDDHQNFSIGASCVVDEKGDIYVLDPGNYRIVVFNGEGAFQREWGKQGQGPGELMQPSDIGLDSEGRPVVFDMTKRNMTIYGKNGEYLSDKMLPQRIMHLGRPFFMSNGNLLFFAVLGDAAFQMTFDLSLWSPEFEQLKSFHANKLPPTDWSQSQNPDFWVGFLKGQFEALSHGAPVGAAIDGKTFVAARANEYKGKIYDQDANELGAFTKQYKAKAFTDDAKYAAFENVWQNITANPVLAQNMPKPIFEKALEATDAPPALLPFVGLCRLGDGFAAIANWDVLTRKGTLEVFDRTGKLLGIAPYQGNIAPFYGTATHVYSGGFDDEDNVVIDKFRVKGL